LCQAEDGIRVRDVTGVQTCALPIYGEFRIGAQEFWNHAANNTKDKDGDDNNEYDATAAKRLKGPMIQVRKYPMN